MAKRKQLKKTGSFSSKIWEAGAAVVTTTDKALDKFEDFLKATVLVWLADLWEDIRELGRDGMEFAYDVGAEIVIHYDKTAEIFEWFVIKNYIHFMRRFHDFIMELSQYRRVIIRDAMILLCACVGTVALFAFAVDYEYSYNGRALGIVKEQQDVLEILDMVSEELSAEYGSSIVIDPETDITFRPVISYGKDIDDADMVLKRFTYMGDIHAQAYAIVVDGERIITVESEKIANEVLDSIKDVYTKDKESKYEYVGFVEDVKVEPYNTTLANVRSKSAAIKKMKSGGQEKVTYTVQAGDTLYGICDKLGVTLDELTEMNPQITEDIVLHSGDEFVTQQEIPLVTVETVEVATFAESLKYKTEYEKSGSYYQGDRVVAREGKKGKARITARLTKQNGKTVKRKTIEKVVITEPVNKLVIKGTKPVPAKKGTGSFMRPVNAGVYAAYGMRWGRMHYGLDYAAPTGTPIYAADGGTVIKAAYSGAYGNVVIIDHGANKKTVYAHCSSFNVSYGEKVFKGQRIASVGNTGRSTGPHCHFEILINGVNVNPSNYV